MPGLRRAPRSTPKLRPIGSSVRRLACTVAFALLLAAPRARAEGNAAAAQALFEEGRAAMARGDYAAACPKLEGSRAIDPAAGTEYNLALCYEKSGRSASAWATYLSAAAAYKATNRPEWETRARDRAETLSKTLPKLTIAVADVAGVKVTRDGAAVVASELGVAIPVDPGHHVVTAEAPGRMPFRAEVDVAAGKTETVEVVLAHEAAPPPSAPPREPEPTSWRGTTGIVLGGAGVAGIALGTVAGLVALERHNTSMRDCPESGPCASDEALRANATAHDWASVSTAGFVVGGALLAAGVVLFVTAPRKGVAMTPSGMVARW